MKQGICKWLNKRMVVLLVSLLLIYLVVGPDMGIKYHMGLIVKNLPGSYALALYDLDTDTLYYFQRNL